MINTQTANTALPASWLRRDINSVFFSLTSDPASPLAVAFSRLLPCGLALPGVPGELPMTPSEGGRGREKWE